MTKWTSVRGFGYWCGETIQAAIKLVQLCIDLTSSRKSNGWRGVHSVLATEHG